MTPSPRKSSSTPTGRTLSCQSPACAGTTPLRYSSFEPRGSKELYRSGVVPAQAGDWQLSVRPVGVDEDFLGLGVIYKKRDGTR